MHNIRNFASNDFDKHLELSEYAFQYALDDEKREHARKRFKPEKWLACFQDDRLLSQMHLIDLDMYIQGVPLAMGGVASVSTWPEARRKGLVADMLVRALELMKERGQTISALAPFSFGFYRKYGWEMYAERKSYVIPTAKLPRRQDVPGSVRRVQALEHLDELDAMYTAYAARYNGTLKRTTDWWKNVTLSHKNEHSAIYYTDAGEPGGYLRYRIQDREMTIVEWVYVNEQAFRGLWSFVGQHDSMLERVKLIAPPDDPLPYLLDDPRVTHEVVPYFMARIVDVAPFIGLYAFSPNAARPEKTELLLEVQDTYAPWNEGIWRLSVGRDGLGELVRLADERESADSGGTAKLTCGINDLTAMLLGHIQPAALHAHGRIGGDSAAAEELSSLIPRRSTYLMDFF